ncbi:MAG: type II toxin-antitoxin system HicB family antitoxin [bacterium]|mgnify:FL=1
MTTRVARPPRRYRFAVVIEQDEAGYAAFCPSLQGCYAQGRSYEEALANMCDAIRLHVTDRSAAGEPIPQASAVSLTDIDLVM